MSDLFSTYVNRAKIILAKNWTGKSTKPSPSLYPHQWNWDSGFIAMGKSHYLPLEAILEIETLFNAQWSNGMLPQIIFNSKDLGHYFPEPDFWMTAESGLVPEGVMTSGITMPPIHAFAVERIYENTKHTKTIKQFLKRIYPKLMALHRYLYDHRDPFNEGLVYIRHPWESGIDNSPTWDNPLQAMTIDKDALPEYERQDLNHGVDPAMRPSDDDYDRYVYLVELFRKNRYDEKKIGEICPFLIQDPLFNSILCRSNESLVKIAQIIKEDPTIPESWERKTRDAIQKKLWNEKQGFFNAYDLHAQKKIEVHTSAGFMPLFAGAATYDQAERMYDYMNSASFCALHQGNCYTIPNFDTRDRDFDRSNYWRGPIWININWMLAQGLHRYGYTLKADSLRKDLLQLPIRFGFHEYFDSFDGKGYGSTHFSWTAALFIDLVANSYKIKKQPRGMRYIVNRTMGSKIVLNRGRELVDIGKTPLAQELNRTIHKLKENYFDPSKGIVDYENLSECPDYEHYRKLTHMLRRFSLKQVRGRRHKLAFWMNLYNSIVIDAVIALNIKHSVLEVPGFFQRIAYIVDRTVVTADDIEHGILRHNAHPYHTPYRPFHGGNRRKQWMMNPVDPRIHFGLVCGSRSCAPIDFFTPDNVNEQLEEAARSFINSSEVIIIPEEKRVLLSEIFHWYEKDFGGREGILDLIYDHIADEQFKKFIRESSRRIKIEYLHYDWNLNRGL